MAVTVPLPVTVPWSRRVFLPTSALWAMSLSPHNPSAGAGSASGVGTRTPTPTYAGSGPSSVLPAWGAVIPVGPGTGRGNTMVALQAVQTFDASCTVSGGGSGKSSCARWPPCTCPSHADSERLPDALAAALSAESLHSGPGSKFSRKHLPVPSPSPRSLDLHPTLSRCLSVGSGSSQ